MLRNLLCEGIIISRGGGGGGGIIPFHAMFILWVNDASSTGRWGEGGVKDSPASSLGEVRQTSRNIH
jgi:hypothetical protein